MTMRKLIRFRWPLSGRGRGKRKDSCYIEPIEIASTLSAKHCGDQTADCSNGVLIYPAKVVKPYGSTGGIGGVKLKENEKDIASPITARDYKGILRNNGDAIVEIRTVLTPDREEKRQNGRRMKEDGEPMFTLTAQDRHGVAISELPLAYDEQNSTLRKDGTVGTLTTDGSSPKHNNRVIIGEEYVRIRRLTPREVWRLQGFPDEYFDKAAAVISDTQLYKAAGNAVSVPVAKAIGLKLREIEDEETENEFSY